jgi:hypothetical protein
MRASVRALWLGALLVCSGACSDPELPDPAAQIPDWRTYYNHDVGVELSYPYTLSLVVNDGPDAQLELELQWVGRQNAIFKLDTRGPDAEAGLRQGAVPGSEIPVTVGGLAASQFKVADAGGEEPLQRTLVLRGGRLFVFSGAGETFNKVLGTVVFSE